MNFFAQLLDRLRGAVYGFRHGYLTQTTDSLTGLVNRGCFQNSRGRIERRAHKYGLTVVFLDVNKFKVVNDTLGHAAGDYMLRELGNIIRKRVRSTDMSVRWGGDEIVLFLCNADKAVVERLIAEIKSRFEVFLKSTTFHAGIGFFIKGSGLDGQVDNLQLQFVLNQIGLSCGVYSSGPYGPGGQILDIALARADARMYADKQRNVRAIS